MKEDAFLTTQWTQVLAARGNSEDARVALGELSERYYAPVVAFLCKQGRSTDEARDLAHGFFAWLLSRDALNQLSREGGKFRSYLLGALKHFLSHEREKARRLKRGAGIAHVAISQGTCKSHCIEPADDLTLPPDKEFDRQWALHILREAMTAVETDWREAGKESQFADLRPFLDGDAEHGALAKLAELRGTNESTLRSHLHRLRREFRQQVKAKIAPTLEHGADVSNEMAELVAALSS